MKRLLLVAALLAPSLAVAADLPSPIPLPTKAPVFFVDTSGFYWGVEAGAGKRFLLEKAGERLGHFEPAAVDHLLHGRDP